MVPTPTPVFESERKAVEEMISFLRGKYGVYFEEIETKNGFSFNAKEKWTAASLIKMPVLLTLYREVEAGRIKLDTIYKLQAEDKRGGAGSLGGRAVGFEITYREMAKLMGEQSDNTALNIIGNKLLGEAKIQELSKQLGEVSEKNITKALQLDLIRKFIPLTVWEKSASLAEGQDLEIPEEEQELSIIFVFKFGSTFLATTLKFFNNIIRL